MKKPIICSIADTQVDLETFKHFPVDASTSIPAQHELVPAAIKIGMLESVATTKEILCFLTNYSGFVVLDPISHSSLTSLINLFPYTDLVTTNRMEAEKIVNRKLDSYEEIQKAAHSILALGAKSVLLKGSHVNDGLFSQDYWANGKESFWLANPRAANIHYQDAGSTLSAAITACLALGYSIKDALVIAKMYVSRGIRLAQNQATLFHGPWPEDQIDLPYLSSTPLLKLPEPFKHCPIGLYPVVDNSHWLEKLLPLGVKSIQLRMKDLPKNQIEEEIKRSIFLAKKYGATLFINDYWELALQFAADGVHLGQEDLLDADIDKIRQSGLYLGLSTHCYYEVATAHRFNPSYIACGPIYSTTSKIMAFNPQGIEQLQRWRRTLNYPLVAIGGINVERLSEILDTGVEGISLISAITKAKDPDEITRRFLNTINKYSND